MAQFYLFERMSKTTVDKSNHIDIFLFITLVTAVGTPQAWTKGRLAAAESAIVVRRTAGEEV